MSLTLGPIFNSQNGKIREWSISIALYDAEDRQIAITTQYAEFKEGYYATYTARSGYTGMKMMIAAPTVVRVGKNIGKKNETNALAQAVKECSSKYAAKLKFGYTEQREGSARPNPPVPFPMAVQSWKDHKAKLRYPLYVQPKLDGVRMIVKYENEEVQLLTRRLHSITGFKKIKHDLKKMFQASRLGSFIIDGELYSHGTNLQTISGIVRNESLDESVKETLRYYVFDCFNVAQPKIKFDDRIELLKQFVDSAKSSAIVLNDTIHVDNSELADTYYNQFVAHGYEGAIYKSEDKPYEFDFNIEKRSQWYQKRKKQDDSEYPIVGFSQGKGKDVGCIVFELQLANGKTFNCVPNGSYAYRRQLYSQATASSGTPDATSFQGQLAKVVYDDLSKAGVPLRGRIVQIGRDLSFD